MSKKRIKDNINSEIYWAIDYCKSYMNNINKDPVLARMQFDWIEGNIQYALDYLKQL